MSDEIKTAADVLHRINDIAATYAALEIAGHIPLGAITENMNWEEIKLLFVSAMHQAVEAVIVEERCCPECECPESCYFEGPNHVLNQCHWPEHKCHDARQEQLKRMERFFGEALGDSETRV
ncbi:MAG TPA: hypothetical protein VHY35_06440 [Stellaceae bacterium]|jgi:hypothetical protein|nr:hypothetical protein [Stellaceae bacterium]